MKKQASESVVSLKARRSKVIGDAVLKLFEAFEATPQDVVIICNAISKATVESHGKQVLKRRSA